MYTIHHAGPHDTDIKWYGIVFSYVPSCPKETINHKKRKNIKELKQKIRQNKCICIPNTFKKEEHYRLIGPNGDYCFTVGYHIKCVETKNLRKVLGEIYGPKNT